MHAKHAMVKFNSYVEVYLTSTDLFIRASRNPK